MFSRLILKFFLKMVHHFFLVFLNKRQSIIRALNLRRILFLQNCPSVQNLVQMVQKWSEIQIIQVFAINSLGQSIESVGQVRWSVSPVSRVSWSVMSAKAVS